MQTDRLPLRGLCKRSFFRYSFLVRSIPAVQALQRPFAREGTETKLRTVFDYAEFFTNALKNKPRADRPFRLTFVDAFAGTGELPRQAKDVLPMIDDGLAFNDVAMGSARRALEVARPFDRYVFSDTKLRNVRELERLASEFSSLRDRVEIIRQDANEVVSDFCRQMEWNDRAVMFLDPFGNQVTWQTLESIAATRKIDLWYLFPSWWGVVRQIRSDGTPLPDAEASLDRVFGTAEWREHVSTTIRTSDLFGATEARRKTATVDSVTRYMIERMETIFGGGVSHRWLPLTWEGRPSYSLIFACANPQSKARNLAMRVANQIMTRE